MMYPKADQYPDLGMIYAECSGPGGLKLAEFMADKMGLRVGALLLDIGFEHGYQTCFLAKEYAAQVTGIDPGRDRKDGALHVDHLMRNAQNWGVQDRVVGIPVGVPDTKLAGDSFDFAYSTTTFEMLRGFFGEGMYRQAIAEVLRLLRPGGIFGLGEPMHKDVPIPADMLPLYTGGEGAGADNWVECFETAQHTAEVCTAMGFKVLEYGEAPDAHAWWLEYCQYDPYCMADPNGEPRVIRQDGGRWLTYGYVIAQKPV